MPRPGVRRHKHHCACGKVWDCEMSLCSPAHHRIRTCIQCIKREKELNSGEQQTLSFEPVITYTYAQYSDFVNFSDLAIEMSKKMAASLSAMIAITADDYVSELLSLSKEQIKAAIQILTGANCKPMGDLVKL
jgi:hypothetical protein